MIRRIETGELLNHPRLEKTVFFLQKRIKEITNEFSRSASDIRFSVQINHYGRMNVSTILNHNDEENGEFLITGFSYSIELTETDHILAIYETGVEGRDPSFIVDGILRKMNCYDVKHLYYCLHCMHELVERGKDCCDTCELSKITYHEMCAICHDDDYTSVSSIWGKLECGHIFHKHCVLQINTHAPKRIKCPLCRHDQLIIAVAVI
jgi:Ring finger domain